MSNQVTLRPKTRGELREFILKGCRCEVVTDNVEITNLMLDGWLGMKDRYKTEPSKNEGWTIYTRNENQL